MAWLHATPKPPKGTKRATTDTDAPALSRLEKMSRDGVVPPLPPHAMPHIIERLLEIGIAGSNGMGLVPVSWSEIAAWQIDTCVRLAPWEARLIRRLSVDYVGALRLAEDENCPPPWRAEVTRREIETEEARLRSVLG